MASVHRKFYGETKDGKLIFANQQLFDEIIRNMGNKKVEVVVKPVTKKTSLSQHAYYRGVILEACFNSEQFSHYDNPDQIHEEYFQVRFLKYTKLVTSPHGGKTEITLYKSMSEMDEDETSKFIDRVKIDCDMLGIKVQSPEEYWSKYHK